FAIFLLLVIIFPGVIWGANSPSPPISSEISAILAKFQEIAEKITSMGYLSLIISCLVLVLAAILVIVVWRVLPKKLSDLHTRLNELNPHIRDVAARLQEMKSPLEKVGTRLQGIQSPLEDVTAQLQEVGVQLRQIRLLMPIAPIITHIDPLIENSGKEIVINGNNFQPGIEVEIGGQHPLMKRDSAVKLTVQVPQGTSGTKVKVRVKNPDGQEHESRDDFTYK
ncbi:MAG: IPT/TIG domain-containing protein, partial [Candidatus Entotheonellia bacterium]